MDHIETEKRDIRNMKLKTSTLIIAAALASYWTDSSIRVIGSLLPADLAAARQLLTGKCAQAVRADAAAVARPVFLPAGDFPPAQRAVQGGLPPPAAK